MSASPPGAADLHRGAFAAGDALAAGSSDYVTKPANVASIAERRQNVREQLIPQLNAPCGRHRSTAPALPRRASVMGAPR